VRGSVQPCSVRVVSDGEDHGSDDKAPVVPKVVAGGVLAAAGVRLGPEVAVALGASGFIFESLAQRVWEELRPDAQQRAATVLSVAAEAAGCEGEELGELIGNSDRTRLQAGLAIAAAGRTSWPPQVRALGKVLAAGLIASDDAVDLQQFALNAMIELDRLHINLLELLVRYEPVMGSFNPALPSIPLPAKIDAVQPYHAKSPPFHDGNREWLPGRRIWTARRIVAVRPQLRPVFTSTVGTLLRHGLAQENDNSREWLEQLSKDLLTQVNEQAATARQSNLTKPVTLREPSISRVERSWSPTELGEQVLDYYREAATEIE